MDWTTVAAMMMAQSDENGGNTRIDTLREECGDNFAPRRRGDMRLDTLLEETGTDSLRDYLRSKK
jgi:hypothetical protein